MSEKKFKLHDFKWSPDSISRYWDSLYNGVQSPGKGFSERYGDSLLNFVNKKTPLHGKILDYGTGYGFLLEYLEKYDKVSELYGSDFSEESVNKVNERMSQFEKYKGSFIVNSPQAMYEESFFDFIFITEVIEHMTDQECNILLKEANKNLKKNGKIIITVPNNEDLESKKCLCPECGANFHPVQHLRSFNSNSLDSYMRRFSFETKFCRETFYFSKFQTRMGRLIKFLRYIYTEDKLKPNLIYIGEKLD